MKCSYGASNQFYTVHNITSSKIVAVHSQNSIRRCKLHAVVAVYYRRSGNFHLLFSSLMYIHDEKHE